jgi:preprotein translocase subunit SecA
MSVLSRLFGDSNQRALKELQPQIDEINRLGAEVRQWPDVRFAERVAEIRTAVAGDPKNLDQFLPEVFAMVREAGKRSVGLEHFDVQLLGGMVLHAMKNNQSASRRADELIKDLKPAANPQRRNLVLNQPFCGLLKRFHVSIRHGIGSI